MKISNYVLLVVIVVLGVIIMTQNKVIVNLKTEYETGLGGGDISKAQTIDSLQHLADSLYDENYPCQIELNRYQIAYQIFLKRNPKAAEQYGTIISEETE